MLLLPINAFGDWQYLSCDGGYRNWRTTEEPAARFLAINTKIMRTSGFYEAYTTTSLNVFDDLINEKFKKFEKYRVREITNYKGDFLVWKDGFSFAGAGGEEYRLDRKSLVIMFGASSFKHTPSNKTTCEFIGLNDIKNLIDEIASQREEAESKRKL